MAIPEQEAFIKTLEEGKTPEETLPQGSPSVFQSIHGISIRACRRQGGVVEGGGGGVEGGGIRCIFVHVLEMRITEALCEEITQADLRLRALEKARRMVKVLWWDLMKC